MVAGSANAGNLRLGFTPVGSRGEEVKLARQALGMSQAALAAATGVDPTTVRRIERGLGKGEPSKLGVLQSFLKIGPYADRQDDPQGGPTLTGATPEEFMRELARRLEAGEARELARRLEEGGGRQGEAPDLVAGVNYPSADEVDDTGQAGKRQRRPETG